MANGLGTGSSSDGTRDPWDALQAILDEIGTRATASESDQSDLWIKFVNGYLSVQGIEPQPDAFDQNDVAGLAHEVMSAGDAAGATSAVRDVDTLTLVTVEAFLAGRPLQTQPRQENVGTAADPVQLFDGQFTHEATDIELDCAGITFAWTRTYRHGSGFNGPLGFGWDHSYDVRLRDLDTRLIVTTGALRDDVFVQHPKFGAVGFDYWVPPDGQHAIIVQRDDSFVLRQPDGTRFFFEPQPEDSTRHRLARIETRHGNYILLRYRDSLDGELIQLELNHVDRVIDLTLTAEGRIAALTDWTGRTWSYAFDDDDNLVAATTPGTDQHPAGLTTAYEYGGGRATPTQRHSLVAMIDPAGQLSVENDYGNAPGLLEFNRVVRQRLSNSETWFDYGVPVEGSGDLPDRDRPASIVSVTHADGQVLESTFNRFGNLLLERTAGIGTSGLEVLETRHRYNADGNRITSISPAGRVTQFVYGRDVFRRRHDVSDDEVASHPELSAEIRAGFGDLLATIRRAGLLPGGGDPPDPFVAAAADIIVKSTFEPVYHQLLSRSDPRFTSSPDPDAAEDQRFTATLTRQEYVGPDGVSYPDPGGTAQDVTDNLYLARRVLPGAREADGTRLDAAVERYTAYDERGRLIESIGAEGTVTRREYFDAADGPRQGHLRATIVDPDGLAIRDAREVDELGRLRAVIGPRAAGAAADSFRTERQLDGLGLLVGIVSPVPHRYHTRLFYDDNRQLVRVERDLSDDLGRPPPEAAEVTTREFDAQLNLIAEAIGGSSRADRLRTTHCYDACNRRVRTRKPAGNEVWYEFDAFGRHAATTLGACTTDRSTTRFLHDPDGLKTSLIDPRGNRTDYSYDAFGRLVATRDPTGNIARTDYDKASSETLIQFFERQADGTYALLSRCERAYDERGVRILERTNLFRGPPIANDPATDFAAVGSGPGEVLETAFFHDQAGRPVKVVNAKGQTRRWTYDAAGRVSSEEDAAGNETRRAYDPAGNIVRTDLVEPRGDATDDEVFSLFHVYDEVDRRVATTDANGNATRLAYDSRHNLVQRIDPLGAVSLIDYDVWGRRVTETTLFTADGLATGAPSAVARTRYEFDANGNQRTLIDALGHRTEYAFDALDRRAGQRFVDGSEHRYGYDAAGNQVRHQDPNGLVRIYTFDVLNRKIATELDLSMLSPAVPPAGAHAERIEYDGLGRSRCETNDFATITRTFDSLGRVYHESRHVHALEVDETFEIAREFDEVGNVLRVRYPSGRAIAYELDKLGRASAVTTAQAGTEYPGDPSGPPALVARHRYRGRRLASIECGNGAVSALGYDAAGRVLEVEHRARGELILRQRFLLDARGSLRVRIDTDPGGDAAERRRYDSAGRLTAAEPASAPPFDPAAFAPFSAPPDPSELDGQRRLDALLGDLADDPARFTLAYDLAGNRRRERSGGQADEAYVVNDLNQYASVGGTTLSYDANGNTVTLDGRRLRYDFRDQLVEVDGTTLFRDTQGRCVLAARNERRVVWVHDGFDEIESYEDGSLAVQAVLDPVSRAVRHVALEGQDLWLHADPSGSTWALSGVDGVVEGRYAYGPFGTLEGEPATGVPFTFKGYRYDADLGFYDARTRHYHPALGRFLQRDALDRPNLYLFLDNNPGTAVDRMGLEPQGARTPPVAPAGDALATGMLAGGGALLMDMFKLGSLYFYGDPRWGDIQDAIAAFSGLTQQTGYHALEADETVGTIGMAAGYFGPQLVPAPKAAGTVAEGLEAAPKVAAATSTKAESVVAKEITEELTGGASKAAPKPPPKPVSTTALVGKSVGQMRRRAARLIRDNPDHKLRFLLGPDGRFRNSLLPHSELIDRPDLVQMGHLISKKSGLPERIVLQGAWENQFNSLTAEAGHFGETFVENVAIDIDGVGVELKTAAAWEEFGLIPKGTVANAPLVLP